MASFEEAMRTLSDLEGMGPAKDLGDGAGLTRYGITERAFPSEDIEHLTPERAAILYLRNWWEPLRLSDVESQKVATKVFQIAVNMTGPGEVAPAARMLQKAVNYFGAGIAEDGEVGPRTLKAVNAEDGFELWCELCVLQGARYNRLVQINPSNRRFAGGWIKRALR